MLRFGEFTVEHIYDTMLYNRRKDISPSVEEFVLNTLVQREQERPANERKLPSTTEAVIALKAATRNVRLFAGFQPGYSAGEVHVLEDLQKECNTFLEEAIERKNTRLPLLMPPPPPVSSPEKKKAQPPQQPLGKQPFLGKPAASKSVNMKELALEMLNWAADANADWEEEEEEKEDEDDADMADMQPTTASWSDPPDSEELKPNPSSTMNLESNTSNSSSTSSQQKAPAGQKRKRDDEDSKSGKDEKVQNIEDDDVDAARRISLDQSKQRKKVKFSSSSSSSSHGHIHSHSHSHSQSSNEKTP
jgi:hypothetical protein